MVPVSGWRKTGAEESLAEQKLTQMRKGRPKRE